MAKLPFEKYLVITDPHVFYDDHKTNLAILKYAEDVAGSAHPWSGWINLGDLLDFNCLSRFSIGYHEAGAEDVLEYYDAGNGYLDAWQKVIRENKRAEMVLLEGNHDFRVEDYILRNPKDKRVYDYARNLKLEQRGIKWIRNWSQGKLFKKGNAAFSHGLYTNQYHAQKMASNFGIPVYYGHTHDVQEIPRVQMGNDKTIVGKSLGCTCDYKQQYLKGNPTKWQQAFAEFHFRPDGMFTEHTYRIFKHTFTVPNSSKVYDGNAIARG